MKEKSQRRRPLALGKAKGFLLALFRTRSTLSSWSSQLQAVTTEGISSLFSPPGCKERKLPRSAPPAARACPLRPRQVPAKHQLRTTSGSWK